MKIRILPQLKHVSVVKIVLTRAPDGAGVEKSLHQDFLACVENLDSNHEDNTGKGGRDPIRSPNPIGQVL